MANPSSKEYKAFLNDLQSARQEAQKRLAREPKNRAFQAFDEQLGWVEAWTRNGRDPRPMEAAQLAMGVLAVREFDGMDDPLDAMITVVEAYVVTKSGLGPSDRTRQYKLHQRHVKTLFEAIRATEDRLATSPGNADLVAMKTRLQDIRSRTTGGEWPAKADTKKLGEDLERALPPFQAGDPDYVSQGKAVADLIQKTWPGP